MIDSKEYRSQQLSGLTNEIGVYALCDLDGVPIYVGQSVDGIRTRVRRHLTSARSDIIANRQIDVWEVAYVWAWPVENRALIADLEGFLFNAFDKESPLLNGKVLAAGDLQFEVPAKEVVQVVEEGDRLARLNPSVRLPRQISQYLRLVDYILITKDAPHLKRALDVHFLRMQRYHNRFLK